MRAQLKEIQGADSFFINQIKRIIKQSKVIGFAIGDKNTGELWIIAVLPGYINLGIGTNLLKLVEEWLRKSRCKDLWLTTDIDKKLCSYSFYIKNDRIDDRIEDGLRYMKNIKINSVYKRNK